MTNKQIATIFDELAVLMELHEENIFKIKSYQNAYLTLRKLATPIQEIPPEELTALKGVGKAISEKITEYINTGDLAILKKYQDITPLGVQEMLKIDGFGAKKIRTIWKELEIESIGELTYACHENRLMELKGFGLKTQNDLLAKLEFFKKNKSQFHFSELESIGVQIVESLKHWFPDVSIDFCGDFRRKCNTLDKIEILVAVPIEVTPLFIPDFEIKSRHKNQIDAIFSKKYPVTIYSCNEQEFGSKLFLYTGSKAFVEAFSERASEGVDFKNLADEKEVFLKSGLSFIRPEQREIEYNFTKNSVSKNSEIIDIQDIKGILHAHSTYSDGIHSLREMALFVKEKGYEYLGITDHSKAAFYANGLQPERVLAQFLEIDVLNQELAPFKIFKGIESDILSDGSLDYPSEILQQFDFIIASVHSNLKMDEARATHRLLRAIENPFTTILGHPTGRLLLSREGYSIDYQLIIDACAANGVVIEINAHPYRLDLDWRWIGYAQDKNVLLSVNPDAHSKEGISLLKYGIYSAQKGGLRAQNCLVSKNVIELDLFFKNKKNAVVG